MARKRHTEEQIIGILNEAQAGAKTGELCRRHSISEKTFYLWKAKFAGMTVSDAKKLRALEAENSKLKHMLADQLLDNKVLKDLLSKNF
jgi:putative transposase